MRSEEKERRGGWRRGPRREEGWEKGKKGVRGKKGEKMGLWVT